MGKVTDIVAGRGKKAALEEGQPREIVEAATAYLGSEESGVGYLYSGWCQTALPHKAVPNDQPWVVDTDRVSLVVEPGWRIVPGQQAKLIGVPYGSRARLILIYLQTEALRTQSREIELGRSLRHWFNKLGISVGGSNAAIVRDQAERISLCHMTFHFAAGKRRGFHKQSIVETGMFEENGRQDFLEVVQLSDSFFQELKQHPVPIEDAAIKALSNNSQALDIYVWLAYRLHSLAKPILLPWRAVKDQFGRNVAAMNGFRQRFRPNLELALAVYPDAKVDLTSDGLVLHPSRPPVAPRLIAAG